MSEFSQRVEGEIQNRGLLLRGQKCLVAVSGGVDSMVLLRVLHSLAAKNQWQLSVAHFNHRLRGRASDADERLVRKTAAALKLRVVAESADVKAFAAKSKLSLEMAARKLRHEFLARVARTQRIKTIALAHHADDQVELFFLRLLRGAGGEGLAGMKWQSPSPADKTISIVRPLLGVSKGELLKFARESKIRFRDDATNFSSDFLRNRIRNELLPILRKNYQPGLDKAVLRLMEIVGVESEFVSESARAWLAQPKTGFGKLAVAVQRKILQLRFAELRIVACFELIEQLREFPAEFVTIGSGLSVMRDLEGKLVLRRQFSSKFNLSELKLKLQSRTGWTVFGDKDIRWHVQLQKEFRLPQKKDSVEFFDADRIGGSIVLRHWRAGDRFQPIGLKSAAKLQDLFVNAGIPAARRRELVLATAAGGEIFWVEGLRIGERFKLTPQTARKLVWKWSNLAV